MLRGLGCARAARCCNGGHKGGSSRFEARRARLLLNVHLMGVRILGRQRRLWPQVGIEESYFWLSEGRLRGHFWSVGRVGLRVSIQKFPRRDSRPDKRLREKRAPPDISVGHTAPPHLSESAASCCFSLFSRSPFSGLESPLGISR